MLIESFISKIEDNPKKLFLIDGIGAIISAFLLGVLLVRFEIIFGIPVSSLYFLASLPIFFALYDFYCYRKINNKIGLFLKGIAIFNIIYSFISLGLACYHLKTITGLGWIYILIEILIIIFLAIIEYKVGIKIMKKNHS